MLCKRNRPNHHRDEVVAVTRQDFHRSEDFCQLVERALLAELLPYLLYQLLVHSLLDNQRLWGDRIFLGVARYHGRLCWVHTDWRSRYCCDVLLH